MNKAFNWMKLIFIFIIVVLLIVWEIFTHWVVFGVLAGIILTISVAWIFGAVAIYKETNEVDSD